ncbi:hypothetical protein GCM10020000_04280 [Streptomyces olivoverticillatus]
MAGFDFPEAECNADLLALAQPDTYAIETGIPTVLSHGDGQRTRTFPPRGLHHPRGRGAGAPLHRAPGPAGRETAPHRRPRTVRDQRPPAPAERPGGRPGCRTGRPRLRGDLPQPLPQHRRPGRGGALRGGGGPAPDRRLRAPAAPRRGRPPRAGTGHGATEAPRGTLYHRYTLDAEGLVTDACLVPPTSQNQGAIEEDLRRLVQNRLRQGDATDAELTRLCERAIRNHDPCISCSAHFLDLTVEAAAGRLDATAGFPDRRHSAGAHSRHLIT